MPHDQKADRRSGVPVLTLSRGWLALILVAILGPWMVAGALYLGNRGSIAEPTPPPTTSPAGGTRSQASAAGPWGRLSVSPLVISPPVEYVSRTWEPVRPPRWYLPGLPADRLPVFLSSVGISADDSDRLSRLARVDPSISGVVLDPDPAFVAAMPQQTRAALYTKLASVPLNEDQAVSYRYFGRSADDWFGTSLISADTRRLVEPFLYPRGDFLNFADLDLVRPKLDADELQRLVKALLRQSTVQVRVTLDNPSEVAAAVEYWGRGGRRTDIRPLLESLVASGSDHSIDIGHLLPRLAREHLYRYPRVRAGDLDRPILANCLWTALNFFSDQPDDRFLDEKVGMNTLRWEYYVVQDNLQLGDIAAFFDAQGNVFHVAVYIADGLVFGKNGYSPLAPWSLLPIDRLKGHYAEHADDWHVTFHRRNDL